MWKRPLKHSVKGYSPANCPQAAAMSAPLSRRVVTFLPELSKISPIITYPSLSSLKSTLVCPFSKKSGADQFFCNFSLIFKVIFEFLGTLKTTNHKLFYQT